ncbi:OadG family protein [Aestuariirhabdus sp. Z084]|uniref:OadG family protein n=1 Tax=Aestuariirhabdus haliotis TaxID=2918751 RepID=UPI00201B433D|nr:OadG family transporter subunit [Aestuariirhabdus haliotis]MCL6416538.1 OadG family protein [Aestuariirhabdus haliotis]MCL6420528.1 OadG family protein [Aestuariirhabdus haliotis]
MTQPDLMSEGINLMLFGMGFVFVFLTLLVFSTTAMSKIAGRFDSAEPEPAASRPVAAPQGGPAQDQKLLSIINEAIKQHRER